MITVSVDNYYEMLLACMRESMRNEDIWMLELVDREMQNSFDLLTDEQKQALLYQIEFWVNDEADVYFSADINQVNRWKEILKRHKEV